MIPRRLLRPSREGGREGAAAEVASEAAAEAAEREMGEATTTMRRRKERRTLTEKKVEFSYIILSVSPLCL